MRILILLIAFIASSANADTFTGRFEGIVAREKVILTLNQFENKLSGELLGQMGIRLLLKGEFDANGVVLATLSNPITGQSIAVRLASVSPDALTFSEITVNPNTQEIVSEEMHTLTRVVSSENRDVDSASTQRSGAGATHDTALIGNWVSRPGTSPHGGSPSYGERVEFHGDGVMLIYEGSITTGPISMELPGTRSLRLRWKTVDEQLLVSVDENSPWLPYGSYRADGNRLLLMRPEKDTKQFFVRE